MKTLNELNNLIENYPLNDLSDAINNQSNIEQCITNIATYFNNTNQQQEDLVEILRERTFEIQEVLRELNDWGYCDDDQELTQKMIENKIIPILEDMKEELIAA